MTRHATEEAQRMFKAIAILLRNTTWKCGRVERLIIKYLQTRIRKFGYSQVSVKEMMQHFKLDGKQKNEFLDAVKRLEKRQIIRVEFL